MCAYFRAYFRLESSANLTNKSTFIIFPNLIRLNSLKFIVAHLITLLFAALWPEVVKQFIKITIFKSNLTTAVHKLDKIK